MLFDAGEDATTAWLILEGSLDEWVQQTRSAVREAEQWIGEVAVFARQRQSTEAQARVSTKVLAVPAELLLELSAAEGDFANDMALEIASHAASWSIHSQLGVRTALKQVYPDSNRMTFPGPYLGTRCELFYFFIQKPPGGLEISRPPGVEWMKLAPYFLLCAARYPDFRAVNALQWVRMSYQEIAVMVPTTIGDGLLPKLYFPYIYLDSAQPLVAGREVYGYPKMLFSMAFDDDVGGQHRCILRKDDDEVLRLKWRAIDWDAVDSATRAEVVQMALDPLQQRGPRREAAVRKAKEGSSSPLIDAFNALPPALRTLGTGSWKRIFDPATELTGPGPIPWEPSQFQVDGVAGSDFLMSNLETVEFVELDTLEATDQFIDNVVEPLVDIGLRVVIDLELVPAEMMLDYLVDPPTGGLDLRKMAWGPASWSRKPPGDQSA